MVVTFSSAMSHNIPRQLPPSSPPEASAPATSPALPPPTPSDGSAPPQTSSNPGGIDGADPPTTSPRTSISAHTSSTPSISSSSTSSNPSTLLPSSTSFDSSTTLPLTTSSSSMTLSLPLTSSSDSTHESVGTTTSQSTLSFTSTTSFTTIVTTLGDGSVTSIVSPLPTALQTRPNPNPSNSPNRVGIIAGTTVAVVCFILLVLSLVFCYRKNKLKKFWNSLDLRGGRARERRGLLEDEDFDDDLAHGRGRSDTTASGQGPFMLGSGSINMSVGSAAGHGYQPGNSPVLSDASARFISPAIPVTTATDATRSFSPNRSSFPPTTVISTPSSITSSLPAIQPSPPLQNQNQTPNYINYNSSVSSFPQSSPPVPSLFRARASESGSIFREEGVWPPPNEKLNEFVDPFVGHLKKVSSEVGDELGKIVSDIMGPSSLGDSRSGSISSPTPSQQPFISPSPSTMTMLSPSPQQSSTMQKALFLSAPIIPTTTAALGGTSGVGNFTGTGLDDRAGPRKQRQNHEDSPPSHRKSTHRRNPSTPSPLSSPELSFSSLPAPPPATVNINSKGTSIGLSPHDTTVFARHHRSSSSLSVSLPPGAAPGLIPGLSPVVPTPKSTIPASMTSTMKMSPTTSIISPTNSQKSPISASTTSTANTLNTNASLTMRSEGSPVLYKYQDGGMPMAEEDFGSGSGRDPVSNNARRLSGDGFEFLRGEKVDREVVSQELRMLQEDANMARSGDMRSGGRPSSPPARRSSRLTSIPPFTTSPTATHAVAMATSSSLTLSPTSQVKKPSPLKQQTLAD